MQKYMPGGYEALNRYEAYNQRAMTGNPIIYSGNFDMSMGEWKSVLNNKLVMSKRQQYRIVNK